MAVRPPLVPLFVSFVKFVVGCSGCLETRRPRRAAVRDYSKEIRSPKTCSATDKQDRTDSIRDLWFESVPSVYSVAGCSGCLETRRPRRAAVPAAFLCSCSSCVPAWFLFRAGGLQCAAPSGRSYNLRDEGVPAPSSSHFPSANFPPRLAGVVGCSSPLVPLFVSFV